MSQQRKNPQIGSTSPAMYPFAAIVGQEEMKLGLILNIIDPAVGGVLIMGHRGTGKSTAVRALADLLPEISSVVDCVYACDPSDEQNLCVECRRAVMTGTKVARRNSAVPVVELPLGATEDRVCGTIDIEQALRNGVKRFEPGLLARANRGFLYIDEVNLLEDHLVDLLLDVATTGVNKVERESISVEHPARFVLIGSGNPEEGELRPQLLDRFGLYVEVKTEEALEQRMEIVERREAFERNREAFRNIYADEQEHLRKKIARARKNFVNVKLEPALLRQIVQLCSYLKIDGHRGELTITRAARALAAFEGRKKVTDTDVKRVTVMSLRHRLRRDALEETAGAERIEQAMENIFAGASEAQKRGGSGPSENGPVNETGKGKRSQASAVGGRKSSANSNGDYNNRANESSARKGPHGSIGADADATPPVSEVEKKLPKLRFDNGSRSKSSEIKSQLQSIGRRNSGAGVYNQERGRYAQASRFKKSLGRVALDATLRAIASDGSRVQVVSNRAQLPRETGHAITGNVLRFKLFRHKQGRLFIFAIDLSGSMALNRIAQAKGVMLSLLRQSYIERDSVAIVGFRGTSAEVLLPPSRSILRARRALDSIGVGGGTPLSAGLRCSLQLARCDATKAGEKILLLFTDGQANVALNGDGIDNRNLRQEIIDNETTLLGRQLRRAGVTLIVADTQNEFRSMGKALALADKLGAEYRRLQHHHGIPRMQFALSEGGKHDLT